MLLTAMGHRVQTCHSGAEALAVAGGEHLHLVLLDLSMDDMDGFETARRLRAADAVGRPMLLAAVSGYGDNRTRERARAAGFDRHLTKPVSREALAQLLCDAAAVGAREDGPADRGETGQGGPE